MENVLNSLNATYVNELTQEQINGAMNMKLIVPELVIFFIIIYTALYCFIPVFIKGHNSRMKVLGYVSFSLIFAVTGLIVLALFPNTIFQAVNWFSHLLNP